MPRVKLYTNLRMIAETRDILITGETIGVVIAQIDNEASYLLKKIPVVTEEFASGTSQMANKVAEALKNYKIIMLRGHGSIATGQTLDEAFHWSSTLEDQFYTMKEKL